MHQHRDPDSFGNAGNPAQVDHRQDGQAQPAEPIRPERRPQDTADYAGDKTDLQGRNPGEPGFGSDDLPGQGDM